MSSQSPAPSAPPTTPTPNGTTANPPAQQQQNGAKPPLRRIKREKREPTLFQKNPYRPIKVQVATPPPAPAPRPKPRVKVEPDAGKPVVKLEPTQQQQTTTGIKVEGSGSGSSFASTSTSSTAADAASGEYKEFKLMSCDRHGWRYDVMKFDSRKPVDITTWAKPVKMNRKELRREPAGGDGVNGAGAQVPMKPMLGADGKPVIGADGRIVMVDAEGRPIPSADAAAAAAAAAAAQKGGKEKDKEKEKRRRKFQKKTRQVFLVPEHIRQMRREERYPWVAEDGAGGEVWVGRMEEAAKSELYALFMPAADEVFKFVPAHRWYKFQKRRETHQIAPSLEEAEKLMAKMEKNREMDRWSMRSRSNAANGIVAPIAGGATTGASLVYDIGGRSLAPGGRRLKTVDSGMRGLFEEDDEEGVDNRRRRERDRGGEGDIDEMEYEEEFADDEEKMDVEDTRDEEAKEIEERLKREYRNANKTREGYIDESDEDEEGEQQLTGAGKQMKKLVRKIEKNGAYDSDEEANPYASSEGEEEEEEPEVIATGVAQQQTTKQPRSGSQGPGPGPGTPSSSSKPASRPPSRPPSRTNSPAPSASGPHIKTEPAPTPPVPSVSGHRVVAERATSPRPAAPKLKGSGGSRATSPLVGAGATMSRGASPAPAPGLKNANGAGNGSGKAGSRAGSPVVGTPAPGLTKKRKAEDGGVGASGAGSPPPQSAGAGAGAGAGGQPKPKKRKPAAGGAGSPTSPSASVATPASASAAAAPALPPIAPHTELTQGLLVGWLRASASAGAGKTTRDCIQYFQPCLTDEEKKKRFTALVKEVASLKGGVLALKAEFAHVV